MGPQLLPADDPTHTHTRTHTHTHTHAHTGPVLLLLLRKTNETRSPSTRSESQPRGGSAEQHQTVESLKAGLLPGAQLRDFERLVLFHASRRFAASVRRDQRHRSPRDFCYHKLEKLVRQLDNYEP
ncbi:Hypothetical protein SMAX5B_012966 [Scophthalmus maximus]|uniref:Uncharacterized protein n=1 Tax=Scophthalmus maximus TaxID=52904 RepID=A0A2U9BEH6_SCOMX|nr:Hypothetical protein SMAX5B_012966 [Scophthalmus maximus]